MAQAEKQLHPTWELMKSGMPGVPSMEQWIVDVRPAPRADTSSVPKWGTKASLYSASCSRLQSPSHTTAAYFSVDTHH